MTRRVGSFEANARFCRSYDGHEGLSDTLFFFFHLIGLGRALVLACNKSGQARTGQACTPILASPCRAQAQKATILQVCYAD